MSSPNSGCYPFEYRAYPLDFTRQQIRLLEILPGGRSDELQVKIFVASLLEKPNYDALSYCWGDSEASFRIILNHDWYLSIRYNLYHALKDIRRNDSPVILWTDAICIDQYNRDEVADQVGKMRHIYAEAQIVRAWIDCNVDPTCEVFQRRPNVRGGEKENTRPYDQQFWSPVANLENTRPYDQQFWSPVANLLQNDYWKRLWVQQELILAQNILIHCQTVVLESQLVQWLLQVQSDVAGHLRQTRDSASIDLHKVVTGSTQDSFPFYDGIGYARFLIAERDKVSQSPFNLRSLPVAFTYGSLLELFSSTTSLKTSERKDRVYGLLGIALDFEAGDIVVDYSLPLERVYSLVAEMCIKKYQSLMFLCYQPVINDPCELPTWLPAPEKLSSIIWTAMEASANFGLVSAAHGASIQADGLALSVRGVCVDTIAAVLTDESNEEVSVLKWKKIIEDHHRSKGSSDLSSSLIEDDDILTILFPWWINETYDTYGLPRDDNAKQRAAVEKLFEIAENPGDPLLCLEDVVQGRHDRSDLSTVQELQAFRCIWHAMLNNKFVGTTEGRLGLVRYNSSFQTGDEVWALYGCPLPIILRPRSGESGGYIWVGCAKNMSNLMKGEGLAGFPEDARVGFKHQGREIQQIDIW